MLWRSPIAGTIALSELYRTALVRQPVDGRPDGNRYPERGLTKSDTICQILTTLGWTQTVTSPKMHTDNLLSRT